MTGSDYLRLKLEAYRCCRQKKKKFPHRLFQLLKNFHFSNKSQYSYPKVDNKIYKLLFGLSVLSENWDKFPA